MGDGNLEIVRRALDAYSRRDAARARELAAPDLEIHPGLSGVVEGQVFRGPQAIDEFFRVADAVFETFEVEVESTEEVGESRVLALGRVKARPHGGDREIDQQWASVWDLEQGRVRRLRTFFDQRQAEEAARALE